MRKKLLIIGGLLFVGSLLSATVLARAQSIRTGTATNIPKGETVNSSVIAAGDSINIAGYVMGDVYCAGQTINITGTVKGDVMCAGQTVTVSGVVDGDVRLAGQQVRLDGKVERNATLLGQNVTVEKSALVGGDAVITTSAATVDGSIARDLGVAGNSVRVNGLVRRNLSGQVAQLTLGSSANVMGSIDYTSNSELRKEDGAKVTGEVNRRQPKQENTKPKWAVFPTVSSVYMFISFLLVALVLVVLFPRLFERTNELARTSLGTSALAGAGTLFAAPLFILFLAITLVGIPLALMSLLGWLMLLSLSGPVTSYIIGERIMSRTKYKKPFAYMLVGGALLLVLYIVPIVNFFALMFAGIVGTGTVVLAVFGHRSVAKKK